MTGTYSHSGYGTVTVTRTRTRDTYKFTSRRGRSWRLTAHEFQKALNAGLYVKQCA
jgi:hypothetical protein